MKTTEKAEDPELVRQGPTLYPWFFLTLKKLKHRKCIIHQHVILCAGVYREKQRTLMDPGQGPMLKPLLLAKFHIE